MAVIGDRAYLARNNFMNGSLIGFTVEDPANPERLTPEAFFAPRPVDLVGMAEETVSGGRLVVVATGSTNTLKPASLLLFDVTSDERFQWIGSSSVVSSGMEGFIARVALKDGLAYTATMKKGIQIVDLQAASGAFGQSTPFEIQRRNNTEGLGYGQEAVVQTIGVPKTGNRDWWLNDIDVADMGGRTLGVLTGEMGIAVADTVAGSFLFPGTWPGTIELGDGQATLGFSYVSAIGSVSDQDIAAVVGVVNGAGGGRLALAVVDLANPMTPALLGWTELATGGLGPVDVVLKGDQAFVGLQGGSGGRTLVVSLATLSQPRVVGTIEGVGGRLAVGDNGILIGSAYSPFGGNNPLGGVRTAALDALTVITNVDPDPIVVSAGDEVFRNVDISYRTIPPEPQTGEVRIEVSGGSRVATLPAEISESGTGSTRWPQGTIINPLRSYEARLHAQRDGEVMRSFPKRLRFDKVPLAITTRDRVLRIQFALLEQGLFSFTETKYSVRVFLARDGANFPETPSFAVSSRQIVDAYPNVETWFDDVADGSAKAAEGWVTRKLDRMELPPGTDSSIHRQAFEIGAILTGYPKVKVVVVSEGDGTELATKEGLVTAHRDWSEMISRVNDDVRRAAGHFVPVDPIVPEPGTFNPTNALAALGGLTFRALYWLVEQNLGAELLKGLVEGFHDGWQGDKDAVVMIGKAAISPIETAKAIYGFVKDFISGLSQSGGITAIFNTLFEKLQQIELPTVGQVAYYTGYICGFLFEQVVATVAIGIITGGIGALVAKAATLLKGVTWLANFAQKTLSLLRSLAKALEGAKQVIVDSKVARATLAWLKEIPHVVDDIWRLYPDASKIMQKAGRVAVVSKEVAQRALYWLTAVDRMVDDAAVRFITFFEKVGKEAGDRWLTRWTGFRNGKRAVKDGFEATARSGDLPENVQDVLVTAADFNPPGVATKNYPKEHWDKYQLAPDGDRAESSLARLKRTPDDTRFDDEAIGETVKFHSRADVPRMSDDAIEGTGRLANVPCLRVAAITLLAALPIAPGGCGKIVPDTIAGSYATLLPRYEKAAENLKHAGDVAADEAFARMFWAAHQANDTVTAEAVIRAASFPAATPKSVAEYMKAVDFMRDGERRIITGLLDAAPGPPPPFPQASINVRRVGNEGLGSLAEGWEPVAMRRLIEGGSPNLPRPFTRADIDSFGPKLDIRNVVNPPGSPPLPQSIEADCLLTDRTFFDMKHSVRGDPKVTEEQVRVVQTVLADVANRPIDRAVFVTNGPAGEAVLQRINAANAALKEALGIQEDLIRLVEDLGGFP
jgi:hypothetical protein